jgi:hypothetical protein
MRRPTVSSILAVVTVLAVLGLTSGAGGASAASWKRPPGGLEQWYWEIDPSQPGLAGLPPITASYPNPGSANVWDTDLFLDSNTPNAGIPTGRSPVVQALHAAGKYSICYVEAGAQQLGFPDRRDFAPADYGRYAKRYRMRGYPNEWWFDIRGFERYVDGRPGTLRGAAVNIAAGLAKRIGWCALEGQDALEPDDLDGYTNRGATGVRGGGWHLTRDDSLGFERWLAYTAHQDGLAIFQKNDPADARIDAHTFDGMIDEECNRYHDPCAGPGGDGTPYLRRAKPVLNAEYVEDGETTANFCAADVKAGISGALFNVTLNGSTYDPCAPVRPRRATTVVRDWGGLVVRS